MADRFWRGGTASWDGTAGTKWAATVGGAGGASVPTSADDVYFDATSGAVTCTITTTANCLSFNTTGFTGTIAGSGSVLMYGNLLLAASTTWTHLGNMQFPATTGSFTVTSAGKTLGQVVFGAAGSTATWTLGDALISSGAITVTGGTFTTNNFNVTAASLSSSNSNTRTINLGSSTVTLSNLSGISFSVVTGLTFNAGTSTIVLTATTGATFTGGGLTYYNVTFPAASASNTINGANTFNNVVFTAPASAGVSIAQFGATQTINGTLSTTGTAGNRRVWFRGATYGIAQTLTINSAPSLTDADFRDIYVIGTAAPISGTRIGDLRGIRGITASTPKTVYWNLVAGGNWSANAWAASSGGAVSTDNFPLAQDTATIVNTGLNTSATVTWDSAILYTGTFDASARTLAFAFDTTGIPVVYGDWKYGSGITVGGAGTLTFSGRNTQTITSAGKAFGNPLVVDSYGGTVQLADALNLQTGSLTVTNGTFDTKNFTVTAGALNSSNSNVRTINFGSSTVTLTTSGVGGVLNLTTTTNLTFNAGTSTIVFTSASTGMDARPGLTLHNVSFTATGTMDCLITGAQTFNNFSVTAPASAGVGAVVFDGNQTIAGTLTCAGATAVRRLFLRSSTLGTPRTLTVSSLSATDCDFRDITIAGAAAGSSPTRAGNCGGNTGITFPAAKTVYWNLAGAQNWSATGWATGSGGAPAINNFPLAQDTAVFDNTGAAGTVNIEVFNIGTINASSRTTAVTLGAFGTPDIYGNFTLGTGVTISATPQPLNFSGRGTQTITSNGVTIDRPITINCVIGTVQISDALTLGATRTLTLTSGTFDAVTYNVTTGLFTDSGTAARTLKMGSGTWTLSGTGNLWAINNTTNFTFFKGSANIVLSDTSTTARGFVGNGLSYNKLTIGGATGTSTTTISGANQFTELASTKTVAHTISGTQAQTFGAWTVTGTAGNVVTLSGTATFTIAGAAVSGVDYLALGTTTISATSPGEFYAGVNSTATSAAAPLYLTAKPADSTRYWVGGTGNWSDTARWSTTSGTGSGASVPRSHDDVVFDSGSNATAYTATVNAVTGGIRTKALTIAGPLTGNLTLAGSTAIVGIHGNVTLPATGLTRTYSGAITLSGSATGRTLTTNGVTLGSVITVDGVGCGWSLGTALNSTANFIVNNGSFATANYSLATTLLRSALAHSRTVDLGSSVVSISGNSQLDFGTTETVRAALSFISGTSQINISGIAFTFNGNNQTFYNINFTSTTIGAIGIDGSNTFNNFSVAGQTSAGVGAINLFANQTINGTLTLSAGTNATMRMFVRSNSIGTTRTLTCAAFSGTDADFRDITLAGAAAPVSGTRLGDCKGNSGITFGAGVTRYWNLAGSNNWSATGWAASSGASPAVNNFPLAQDTVVFESTSPGTGTTTTINADYNIGTINMSARTSNTMTLDTGSTAPQIYGNWLNGTGTTLSGTGQITFAGRGSQTITSAGVTWTQLISTNSPEGSVTLQDDYTTSNASVISIFLASGTFNANIYNVTTPGGVNPSSVTTSAKTFALGSGTWTISSSGTTPWSFATSTNLTVTGTGTISLTNSAAKTFAGGGRSYSGITLNQGGAGTLTITGNNTFKSITNTYSATGATTIALGTTTQTLAQPWTAAGQATRVLTLTGTSASSPGTLVFTGSGLGANVDYLAITGVRAYSLATTWYAGTNSTNNGSLGWIFAAGTVVAGYTGNFFAFF